MNKIKEYLLTNFPDDIKQKGECLFLHYEPILLEDRSDIKAFSRIRIKNKVHVCEEDTDIKILNFIDSFLIPMEIQKAVLELDPFAFLKMETNKIMNTLYVNDIGKEYKIVCNTLEKNKIVLHIWLGENAFEITDTREEVIKKGKEFMIRMIKKNRLDQLFKEKDEKNKFEKRLESMFSKKGSIYTFEYKNTSEEEALLVIQEALKQKFSNFLPEIYDKEKENCFQIDNMYFFISHKEKTCYIKKIEKKVTSKEKKETPMLKTLKELFRHKKSIR